MGIAKCGRGDLSPIQTLAPVGEGRDVGRKRLLFFRGFFLRGFLARRKLKGGPPLLKVVLQKGIKLPLGAVGDESFE